jgi:hypothetical protein
MQKDSAFFSLSPALSIRPAIYLLIFYLNSFDFRKLLLYPDGFELLKPGLLPQCFIH